MTAGGVEDTALHYKREISAVVKKTTYVAVKTDSHSRHAFAREPARHRARMDTVATTSVEQIGTPPPRTRNLSTSGPPFFLSP